MTKFVCKYCNREFNANANLNRHLKDIHKAPPHYIQDDDPTLYNFTFYMIKNTKNGKRYVGATTQTVKKRWKNGKGYRFNPEFDADIKKYGVESFELIELQKIKCTVYIAKRLEEEYINKLTPEYNKHTCGVKIISPKMTIAASLKTIPDKAKPCIEWQKDHPEEVKEHMKKCCELAVLKNSKPVKCIETGKVYPSATQAAKILGLGQSQITACCKGRTKSYYGQHWRYADNFDK